MLNFTCYYWRSFGLILQNEGQVLILKLTDATTAVREIGKIVSIARLAESVASKIFDYDPKISLSITAIASVAWLGCHILAKKLEPQAQSILEIDRGEEIISSPSQASDTLSPEDILRIKKNIILALGNKEKFT